MASARGSSPANGAPASPIDLGARRVARRDRGRAAGERLDEHEPERLAARGQRGDVRLAVGGERARRGRRGRGARRPGSRVERAAALDERAARRGRSRADERERLGEQLGLLVRRVERGRAEDRERLGALAAGRERVEVDARVDDARRRRRASARTRRAAASLSTTRRVARRDRPLDELAGAGGGWPGPARCGTPRNVHTVGRPARSAARASVW